MPGNLLADGIDFPLVAALGLATFGPLTLLVTAIESWVFKLVLKTRFRDVFGRVLIANLWSTLAGGILYAFQDGLVHASGIMGTIPRFVHGYPRVAGGLILLYYAQSVLVEGVFAATPKFTAKLDRRRGQIVRAVVLGNVASYLVVGPLYIFTTRPTFGGLKLTDDTTWTANADLHAFFVDTASRQIQRIDLDGRNLTTLVPFPAAEFLISGDESTIVFRGRDGNLYLFRKEDAQPALVGKGSQRFMMDGVTLSPDNRRIAFAQADGARGDFKTPYQIEIVEIDSGRLEDGPSFISSGFFWPKLAWSADGFELYVATDDSTVTVFQANAPYAEPRERPATSIDLSELVDNHLPSGHGQYGTSDDWGRIQNADARDLDSVVAWRGLGGGVHVRHGDETTLLVRNDYGLLKLGLPAPEKPSFLPKGNEILVEWWDQLYIIDVDHRRMGLLCNGSNYVLPLDRFRVHFAQDPPMRR